AKSGAAPELHKPHAPLEQPATQQAPPREIGALFFVDAIQRLRLRSFGGEVRRLGNRQLHPRGQFVVVDPAGQRGIVRAIGQVPRQPAPLGRSLGVSLRVRGSARRVRSSGAPPPDAAREEPRSTSCPPPPSAATDCRPSPRTSADCRPRNPIRKKSTSPPREI